MEPHQLIHEITERLKTTYLFYPFGGEIVCVKNPLGKKYFLNEKGCSCPGFKSWGVCKHHNMIKGVWTPPDGTESWYDSTLGDLIPLELAEEGFNTAVGEADLGFPYVKLCGTLSYRGFSMGVEIKNTRESEEKIEFFNIIKKILET